MPVTSIAHEGFYDNNTQMHYCLLAGVAALAAALAGCGAGASAGGGLERPSVVATTGIAADIMRKVGGEDVEVIQIIPGSASPHGFEESAQDVAAIGRADLLVHVGAGLEENLAGPIARFEGPKVALVDHLDHPRRLAARARHEGGHASDGATDPHFWMDPTATVELLPGLAAALSEVDARHAQDYERRAAAYERRLRRVDREMTAVLAPVPERARKLVTSHDSLGYFARRYDFEVVGAPFGLSPDAQPSSATVGRLIERVERQQVPAIFAQRGDNPAVLRQIAREANVGVVDDLLVSGVEGDGSYEQALLFDARRVAGALGG